MSARCLWQQLGESRLCSLGGNNWVNIHNGRIHPKQPRRKYLGLLHHVWNIDRCVYLKSHVTVIMVYHLHVNLLFFLRPVRSSGVAEKVIDGYLPSSPVMLHSTLQPHHFQVSVHIIHPRCLPSSSTSLSGTSMSIVCLQTCSGGRLIPCPNHSNRIYVTVLDLFATPTRLYAFLYVRVILHIH